MKIPTGICPTESDIGRKVVYRGGAGEVEEGFITGLSKDPRSVFVRYGMTSTPQSTNTSDLEWIA